MPGYELIGKEEQQAINRIFDENGGVLMAHGFDAMRKHYYVREFEQAFAKKIDAPYATACTSGTSALYIALKCLGVGPRDEVIIPAFTFVATAEAVHACGASIVIVNINNTFNLDPDNFKKKITEHTKAVIPVHMAGNPCEMDEIMEIAEKNRLFVVEDCCQALGATYKGKSVGLFGSVGCFSFDGGKIITTGEGGMIITKTKWIFDKCSQFIDHGHIKYPNVPRGREIAEIPGFNFRMTEMQAAIGIAQLKKLDTILAAQRKNKEIIKNILQQSDKIEFRTLVDENEAADSIIFLLDKGNYFADRADTIKIVEQFKKQNILTKNLPDALLWHYAKYWNQFDYGISSLRNSDKYLLRAIALPVMVKWTEKECVELGEKVLKILK